MRLFIALELAPKEYFKELQKQIGNDLAIVKWVDSFHITLKFFGEVPEKQIDELKHSLQKIKFRPFKLETKELGVFPSENYISVIWLGFKDNRDIIYLQSEIEKSLLHLFPKDERFSPHLTLGRVKLIKQENKQKLMEKLSSIKPKEKEFKISNFKLIKSELTKQWPIYEDLASF